jgi:hypothetical protein
MRLNQPAVCCSHSQPSGPDWRIITVLLPGLPLAAGAYDITFYGPSLKLDDFLSDP